MIKELGNNSWFLFSDIARLALPIFIYIYGDSTSTSAGQIASLAYPATISREMLIFTSWMGIVLYDDELIYEIKVLEPI